MVYEGESRFNTGWIRNDAEKQNFDGAGP